MAVVVLARVVAVLAAAVVVIIASGSVDGVIIVVLAVCVTTIQDLVDAAVGCGYCCCYNCSASGCWLSIMFLPQFL